MDVFYYRNRLQTLSKLHQNIFQENEKYINLKWEPEVVEQVSSIACLFDIIALKRPTTTRFC